VSTDQEHGWPPPLATAFSRMLGIRYPIIQAGMVWTAGRKLAVAVSQAGALGIIGAGSMKGDLLRDHIRKTKSSTSSPFGVNIPLARNDAEDLIRITVEEGVHVVVTSSGHPALYTEYLKKHGCTVVHVIAAVKHARKAKEAGCDAVVAEGFEAGGHNGVDELTTLALVPQVVDAVDLPVIAAGGIADGRGMAAALALGASVVQVGTRFAATVESSAHEAYKAAILAAGDNDTILTLRRLVPTRMLKTPFAMRAQALEREGATAQELRDAWGDHRERKGIFEGNMQEGALEAGQSAGLVRELLPAGEVVRTMMEEYYRVKAALP
jgi:enoyl-[acyl-carrier protein] reductase II